MKSVLRFLALASTLLVGLSATHAAEDRAAENRPAPPAQRALASEHKALVAEHALRAEPFQALAKEVSNLVSEARQCAADVITTELGAQNPVLSVSTCAPAPGALSQMRRQLDTCFARQYRELDNLIVRLKGTAALAVFRGQGEQCAFNKTIEAFGAKYDVTEKAVKAVGAEALTFLNQLGECAAEAERLVRLSPVDIENLELRRLFQQKTDLLRRVAELPMALDMPEPLKAWTDCREALAFSRDLLTRAESVVVAASRTVVAPRAPKAAVPSALPAATASAAASSPGAPAPAASPTAPASADEQRRGITQLVQLGDEVSFVESFIRQLGTFELRTAELGALQTGAGQCEQLPQSLIEEVTEKLGCYATALEKAIESARAYAGKTVKLEEVVARLRKQVSAK